MQNSQWIPHWNQEWWERNTIIHCFRLIMRCSFFAVFKNIHMLFSLTAVFLSLSFPYQSQVLSSVHLCPSYVPLSVVRVKAAFAMNEGLKGPFGMYAFQTLQYALAFSHHLSNCRTFIICNTVNTLFFVKFIYIHIIVFYSIIILFKFRNAINILIIRILLQCASPTKSYPPYLHQSPASSSSMHAYPFHHMFISMRP